MHVYSTVTRTGSVCTRIWYALSQIFAKVYVHVCNMNINLINLKHNKIKLLHVNYMQCKVMYMYMYGWLTGRICLDRS